MEGFWPSLKANFSYKYQPTLSMLIGKETKRGASPNVAGIWKETVKYVRKL